MLPVDLAGWKYTVTVATMCFPSLFPRKADTGGTKVAMDPKRYAMEHLRRSTATLEVNSSYALCETCLTRCTARFCFRGLVAEAEASFPSNGARSSSSSTMGGDRRVKARRTRSPVLGRMKVACRSYWKVSVRVVVSVGWDGNLQ